MKQLAWLLLFAGGSFLAVWIMWFSNWTIDDNPVGSAFACAYFLFGAIGGQWLLYDC
jgi:hypothetical protein